MNQTLKQCRQRANKRLPHQVQFIPSELPLSTPVCVYVRWWFQPLMKRAFDGFYEALVLWAHGVPGGTRDGCLFLPPLWNLSTSGKGKDKKGKRLPRRFLLVSQKPGDILMCLYQPATGNALHPALSFHNPNQLRRMNHCAIIITVRFTSYSQRWRRNKWSACYLLLPFPEGSFFKHILPFPLCLSFPFFFLSFFVRLSIPCFLFPHFWSPLSLSFFLRSPTLSAK